MAPLVGLDVWSEWPREQLRKRGFTYAPTDKMPLRGLRFFEALQNFHQS